MSMCMYKMPIVCWLRIRKNGRCTPGITVNAIVVMANSKKKRQQEQAQKIHIHMHGQNSALETDRTLLIELRRMTDEWCSSKMQSPQNVKRFNEKNWQEDNIDRVTTEELTTQSERTFRQGKRIECGFWREIMPKDETYTLYDRERVDFFLLFLQLCRK